MIDFIKIGTKINDVDAFLQKLKIRYEGKFDGETYEVTGEYFSRIKNISIRIHASRWLIISGSIHKYWNQGKHNNDDFTIQNFIVAIEDLSEIIGLNLWDFRLFKIEAGVNIIPPIITTKILHNTFMHKKVDFKWVSITGVGTYYNCKHNEYHIKLYDKAKQHDLPYELLRYEIFFTSEMLKKNGIYKVSDVLLKENIDFMVKFLLIEFTNILFYDPTIKKQDISEQQKVQLSDWSNPRFWSALSKSSSSKNIFSNTVNRMRVFLLNHSENIQGQNLELIKTKLGELLSNSPEEFGSHDGRNGKDFDSGLGNAVLLTNKDKNGSFGCSIIDPLRPEGPQCPVTKLNLSIQSSDTAYLTQEGIKYLQENFPKIYSRLIELYAPKFLKEPDSIKINKIEKSIYRIYQSKLRKSKKEDFQDKMNLFDYNRDNI